MTALLTTLFARLALPLAILFSPFLIVRCLAPRLDLLRSLLWAAVTCIVLNSVVPVLLHLTAIPIVPCSLAAVHWLLAALLIPPVIIRCGGRFLPPAAVPLRTPLLAWGGLCVLVLPFTPLAGIDTYKWLDLAGNLSVRQSVPWLVHPLSLLGFTPRSYPSLQPLLLGTISVLGNFGVDWSYYLVSVICAGTGILTSYTLGRACFNDDGRAALFAFLYTWSPVFIRYTHWATGRGIFLALLPLFLAGLVELPRRRAWLSCVVGGALLPLAHKIGLPAVVVVVVATVPGLLLARLPAGWLRGVALAGGLAALTLAVLVAPAAAAPFPIGNVAGLLRLAVTRFGWMLPLAAVGVAAAPRVRQQARRILPAALATFPLAFNHEMYGALMHLPGMVFTAVVGLQALQARRPRLAVPARNIAIVLTLLGAETIVAYRSATATPVRVREAARFLERHDPAGPFRIVAPGDARQQIQGYVSGCPRFDIRVVGPVRARVNPPPSLRGRPRRVLAAWIAYTRHVFSVAGVECELYGNKPRYYHVVIDGKGTRPAGAKPLYDEDGVEVYGPVSPVPDT